MAQPALHFAVGATCGTCLSLVIGPVRRRWYRLGPLLATAAGIWACLPDLDHVFARFPWLPASESVSTWGHSHVYPRLVNFFFFHGLLDRYYAGRGTIVGLAYVLLMYTVFFYLLGRRIARLECVTVTDEKGREP